MTHQGSLKLKRRLAVIRVFIEQIIHGVITEPFAGLLAVLVLNPIEIARHGRHGFTNHRDSIHHGG
ncbi:hypothetical protein Xish_03706 [Xenorhabdus ishibashii]|uniref:Uncharacterized protein n=1 Tax=Xenorhabdus ishibashii TaxID=1034471 RepID=A0A2D0K6X1_9GAMM|nr:hypothetical protein Xish_03706 [Xenorhabdus ishibashii]